MTNSAQSHEYKTITLPFAMGVFMKGTPDIAAALNGEAAQGWRLQQIIMPSASGGGSSEILAILERKI
jgi:hypothetical protein